MTVLEFVQKKGYKVLCNEALAEQKQITGVYICDLLSMAMANVKDGNLWITVHTNVNIVAVASLANASCVIIPQSIPVEALTVKKAEEQGVILIQAPQTSYEIAVGYYSQSAGSEPC